MSNISKAAAIVFLLTLTLLLPLPTFTRSIKRHKRIVGGRISEDQKWNYVAVLESKDTTLGQWNECTATIISSRHIITAAHCIASLNILENTFIHVM